MVIKLYEKLLKNTNTELKESVLMFLCSWFMCLAVQGSNIQINLAFTEVTIESVFHKIVHKFDLKIDFEKF